MCGIFGWLLPEGQVQPMERLRALTDMLAHRGPDGSGYWLDTTADGAYQIAFGHRRLAIIDLSEAGAQPMWGRDQRSVVVYNGEIYNYIELRRELERKGYTFHSASDTEVLLNAYDCWGVECLKRFRGMFAFALFDLDHQQVLLARDPFGKKPLYIYRQEGRIVFSSEIAPILGFPGVAREFDSEALPGFLLNRYVPGPRTFFRHVSKLAPGSYALWKNGYWQETRYFIPPLGDQRSDVRTLGEAVEAFREVFDKAVRIRMRSDAPYGAYLSGGLDSSAVVAVMARHSSQPVRTFSIGFREEEFSELGYARIAAEHFATRHTPITLTPASYFAQWESATKHRGAPVTEPADLAVSILSREAFSSVRMVLTGEGADELFAGYPKHRAEPWIDLWQRLTPRLLDGALSPIARLLPYRFHRAKVLLRSLRERDWTRRMQGWFGGLDAGTARALAGRQAAFGVHDLYPFSLDDSSLLRRMLFFDQTSWLPDNLLERGDRMMMQGSIEGRMPFMDVELARFAARLPDRCLASFSDSKIVLRRAMAGVLPRTIHKRSKKGFPIPIEKWFREEFREPLRGLLASAESRLRRCCDSRVIDQLLAEHLSQVHNHGRTLGALASLEIFLRQFDLNPTETAKATEES